MSIAAVAPQPSYTAFGLSIQSEIELPDLYAGPPTINPDVIVRLGRIDSSESRPGLSVIEGDALLNIPDVARFWIQEGRKITVEPAPEASQRNVRLYLLGSALGAILHQRRILPLHANAIEMNGFAVAFAGHSGAGKSTLAAWFHDHGYRVISDDVCAVRPGGKLLVAGGLPRLRLWQDALAATGRNSHDFEPSFDGESKFDVPMTAALESRSCLLGPVYILRRADSSDDANLLVQQLAGVQALDALMSNTYRGAFAHELGGIPQLLATCLKIARAVPIFEVTRPWGFESFDRHARRLEDHALSVCQKISNDSD